VNFIKILFVFFFLKVKEFVSVLPKIGKFIWKEAFIGMAFPVCGALIGIFLIGFGLTLIWNVINPVSAQMYIAHTGRECTTPKDFFFVSRMCTGVASVFSFILFLGLYCAIAQFWLKVVKFLKANWDQATVIVMRGKV